MTNRARLIAFYLPQYHPIPENDDWWGKGFTEWTNVSKARSLFRGHSQPNLPADLGFYDLRLAETRFAQAELAKQYGIEAFCYWHYYFGNGKRLLERPFQEVLSSKKPDFPFCLAWANQTWTGIWHGSPNKILIEQLYPGLKDFKQHFYEVLPAFTDDRYLQIDGKPVFLVYAPMELPDPNRFTDYWRELACQSGIKGLYFIGIAYPGWSPCKHGFDAATFHPPLSLKRVKKRLLTSLFKLIQHPSVIKYADFIKLFSYSRDLEECYYPCVMPSWDNTPRCGAGGVVLENSTPLLYEQHLRNAIDAVFQRDKERRVVFIKSWNEWAEGNYLEPDHRYSLSYLSATQNACQH
jgi:hypothetical protein